VIRFFRRCCLLSSAVYDLGLCFVLGVSVFKVALRRSPWCRTPLFFSFDEVLGVSDRSVLKGLASVLEQRVVLPVQSSFGTLVRP